MRRDTLAELRLVRAHSVLVLVSAIDRRIVPALRFVSRLPFSEAGALHISFDADDTRHVAHEWMRLGLTWLPLEIRDGSDEGLVVSVRDAVREKVEVHRPLTVVVPELDWPKRWHRLLHRGTARRLAAQLQALPDVTAVIVPLAWPPSSGDSVVDP